MEEEFAEALKNFNLKIADLMEEHGKGKIPPYEAVHSLIRAAVSLCLYTAPNLLVGFKTINASVNDGIDEYKELFMDKENEGEVVND